MPAYQFVNLWGDQRAGQNESNSWDHVGINIGIDLESPGNRGGTVDSLIDNGKILVENNRRQLLVKGLVELC